MLVNRRPKRRRHKGRMPAALRKYWATHRRGTRRRRHASNPHRRRRTVRVRHVLANRRRRRSAGVPSGPAGFFSARFLMDAGFGALGAVTPTLVTDRLLPMVGFVPTGIMRRALQFAVPTLVLMVGGRKFLGRGTGAFAIGAYAVTALGLVTDFAPGMVPALSGNMGRYALPAPVMGRFERTPAILAGR